MIATYQTGVEAGASRAMASMFNGALGAAALAALDELGLLETLHAAPEVRVDEFCAAHALHAPAVMMLARVLQHAGIVSVHGDVIARGTLFEGAYRDKGFFLWLIRGYGAMLEELGSILRNDVRTDDFVRRNPKYIALAGRDYGARYVDPHFDVMLAETPFTVAADLGCGSGERLVRLARRRPECHGIGIDISPAAIALAGEAIASAGLGHRVRLLHADVRALEPQPDLARVDVAFSFFMGHDLWPRERCGEALRTIRHVMPRLSRFLLCDTYRSNLAPSVEPPIFTLGFEVTHAVMGQYIPTLEEWLDLFASTGWCCVRRRDVDIAFSTIFDLRPDKPVA